MPFSKKIKISLLSNNAKIPTIGSIGSAGIDFYTPVNCVIKPWGDLNIPLDISIKIPKNYCMVMKEKSGVSLNKKLHIGACVIDSDYRGNIHAHFFNNSNKKVIFKKGDKIIQGIIIPYINDFKIVNKIKIDTKRGKNGFGSTGNT